MPFRSGWFAAILWWQQVRLGPPSRSIRRPVHLHFGMKGQEDCSLQLLVQSTWPSDYEG